MRNFCRPLTIYKFNFKKSMVYKYMFCKSTFYKSLFLQNPAHPIPSIGDPVADTTSITGTSLLFPPPGAVQAGGGKRRDPENEVGGPGQIVGLAEDKVKVGGKLSNLCRPFRLKKNPIYTRKKNRHGTLNFGTVPVNFEHGTPHLFPRTGNGASFISAPLALTLNPPIFLFKMTEKKIKILVVYRKFLSSNLTIQSQRFYGPLAATTTTPARTSEKNRF